jgi:hypothetical protein
MAPRQEYHTMKNETPPSPNLRSEEPEIKEYCVTWGIELDAESPEDAAQKALAMLRDPNSQATIFQVEREDYPAVNIDLLEIK